VFHQPEERLEFHNGGQKMLNMILDNCLVSTLLAVTCGGLFLLSTVVDKLQLTSNNFGEGRTIPIIHAYTGVPEAQNISPALKWTNPPAETKSFALVCIDRHPIAANWVHWLVVNISYPVNSVSEGASRTNKMPAGSTELRNSFGSMGWGGPQPPKGSGVHQYEFLLYCLNVEKLDLSSDAGLAAFNKAIGGKVLASARLIGTCER
jgi:Raf kinase inhibitor-like YbhB/YbcL family protein